MRLAFGHTVLGAATDVVGANLSVGIVAGVAAVVVALAGRHRRAAPV